MHHRVVVAGLFRFHEVGQRLLVGPLHEVPEALLTLAAFREVGEQILDCAGHLVDRDALGHPVGELRVLAQSAAEADVQRLDRLAVLPGLHPPERDVGNLWLRTGGGTAREVDVEVLDARREFDVLFQPAGVAHLPVLRLHDGQRAELTARTGDRPAHERVRVRRVVVEERFREQVVEFVLRYVGHDDVLSLGDAHLAGAVLVCEAGEFLGILDAHPPDEDVQADVVVAVRLFVDADVVRVAARGTPGVVRVVAPQVLAGGPKLEVHVLVLERLANLLGAHLVDEELHPGAVAVLAVAVVAEQRRERPADLAGLLGRHEHVETAGEARFVAREAAADVDVEAAHGLAVDLLRGRFEGEVVDIALPTALPAAGHGDLPLPREVRVVLVALVRLVEALRDGERVDVFVLVLAGDRTADDVAPGVAAGLLGREPDRFESLEDVRHVLDVYPVELDRLAGGPVDPAVAEHRVLDRPAGVLVGDVGDDLGLSGLQDAVRRPDAQHEVALLAVSLVVQSPPLEPLEPGVVFVVGNRVPPLVREPEEVLPYLLAVDLGLPVFHVGRHCHVVGPPHVSPRVCRQPFPVLGRVGASCRYRVGPTGRLPRRPDDTALAVEVVELAVDDSPDRKPVGRVRVAATDTLSLHSCLDGPAVDAGLQEPLDHEVRQVTRTERRVGEPPEFADADAPSVVHTYPRPVVEDAESDAHRRGDDRRPPETLAARKRCPVP